MRFLLKQSSSSIVANRSKKSSQLASDAAAAATVGAGKAWGQQCSPNCGCVLRIETQLSDACSSPSSSPTIVQASYHAKRVMATSHKTCTTDDNNTTHYLKPLTTQGKANSSPILTSCTCPTLHYLAQQTVDHLPGKTLAQMRNEIDMGTVGARSSIAFRHTVLRENVLPTIIASTKKQKLGITKRALIQLLDENANVEEDEIATGVHAMNSTNRHGHCYDLVEDSLLSMINERMPTPRNDSAAESYSPTLGGYFRMYSSSGRNQQHSDHIKDDIEQDENAGQDNNELASIHEASDWQQRSAPSSFFLFGEFSMTGMFIQHLQDSIGNRLLGNVAKTPAASTREDDASEDYHRPTTTYLQLLDMYGDGENANTRAEEQAAIDDWLEYVDQMHSQGNRSFSA